MIEMRKIVSAMALTVLLGVSVLSLVSGASEAESYEMTTTVGNIGVGRAFAAVVAVDDMMYVIGGGSALLAGGDPSPTVDDVIIYDMETGEESRGASMLKGVGMAACAVGEDGLIYVIGGWNSTDFSYYGRVQVYDPVADSWSLTTSPTPTSVGYGASCLGLDGRIYVFGGGWSPDYALAYDPAEDEFETLSGFPYGMHGGSAVALSDTAILVAGGANGTSGLVTAEARLYNPQTDTYTLTGSMGTARNMMSLSLGRTGYVYAIGGCNGWSVDSATKYSSIEVYDPDSGEWSPGTTSLSYSRTTHGSVVDSVGRIWVATGYSSSMVTAVEMMLTSEISGLYELYFVSPSDGATVSGVVAVQITLANSYFSPLMGLDLYVDGELLESQSYDDNWVFIWDTSGLEDGSVHELLAVGYDWDASMREASISVVVSALTVDEKLDMLEAAVADLSTDLAALQAAVDLQGTDLADLQIVVDEIQAGLDTLTEDVSAMDAATSERIAALETQLDGLETTLADLQGSVDDVQTSVDGKADNTMLYAIIGLLVVVIVLLLVMMVMGRKTVPPPPAP